MIANWRQDGRDTRVNGTLLTWSKHVEFMRLIDLAGSVPIPIEPALAASDGDGLERLRAAGWRVRPARPRLAASIATGSSSSRRRASSPSPRSSTSRCVAAGSATAAGATSVIVQDTAFDCALPIGEGLFAFRDVEQARHAFAAVLSDYGRHCRAARALAEEHLCAETVLDSLLSGAAAR
jgi:hypothetical protein